ncbi:glycoside hydrolase family 37 protein [Dichomitus squalens LYAD-421 SS1]|uniref:Trehalase n=1 Tax=Dichomitus squalens (strain LYAD-421) TaxID=732165 RepID=R7SJI7_DICSQ|nr:glycoside hydrolase family 37 protein [Dichomitus squalens LYAD-421 SS1]EJF56038.1 glycoside hydrolase family 37 protein [Dichomitus squalens LYAD-421 SS1]
MLVGVARAMPQASVSSATAPSITLSTAVASPSVPLSSPVPSQIPLPPKQAWCPSEIFCAGELLQTVNLAAAYSDPKTFVDKPTSKSSHDVLAAFDAIGNTTATEGDIVTFLDTNFRGEGLELEAVALSNFNDNPAFLNNVSDPLVRAFSQTVHGYWTSLIRNTNQTALCQEGTESGPCESTLIALNHTFVVPGGRFREQYYWDSYWIVQGLIKSELFDTVKDTLENFMDEIQNFGFIPNGGRIYYLDRSQPPLFIHMLSDYVAATNDTSVLDRALPLAEKELAWWATQRTVNVTSPFTNKTYALAHYAVNNTAPRPESYLTDYLTANDPTLQTPLTADERSNLYAELASGAETGWDYSSRWAKEPLAGTATNQNPVLRSLNVRSIIPVCLNSILYKAHTLLADLYDSQNNATAASTHRNTADVFRSGVLDLFWDASKLAFYDFNLTANARSSIYSAATFYPLWNGIIPDELLSSSQNAFGFFAALNMVLNRYNGTFPVTFIQTGLQWDAPNAWPPHQYIALEALRVLPSNITSNPLPTPNGTQSTFDLIPSGQIGVSEDALPAQAIAPGKNASQSGPSADVSKLNGTVVNGGNKTDGEGWAATLQRELANRYIASALCSWHATGGEIQGLLPRLSDQELNVTQSVNNTGNMFEKFSISDIDSAGRGGEYTVQAGFGWTNGAVLWVASNFGDKLVAPECPDVLQSAAATSGTTSTGGSGNNAASSARAPAAFVAAIALFAALAML